MAFSVPLNLPPDGTARFLDYFRANVPFTHGWTADHHVLSDGTLVEEVSGVVDVAGGPAQLELRLRWRPDGSLESAEFDAATDREWEPVAREWLERALADALSNRLQRFYFKDALTYFGSPLDGEYWLDGFRVAPFEPWGSGPSVEQVTLLECDVDAVDVEHAGRVGKVRTQRFAALLSLFLGVGLTRNRLERRWVRLEDGTFARAVISPPYSQFPRHTERPRKGELHSLGKLRPVDRTQLVGLSSTPGLQPPSDIRDLFRAVHSLSPRDEEAFLGVANLARIALTVGRDHPSVRLAYWVAAVDALPSGQQGEAGFKRLVEQYCPEAPKGVIDDGYSRVRSAHFHAGATPGGEHDVTDAFLLFSAPEAKARAEVTTFVPLVMHNVIIRWLLDPAGRLHT